MGGQSRQSPGPESTTHSRRARAPTIVAHMIKASQGDRSYFARIAQANGELDDEPPPSSLDEVLERMDRMRRNLGSWAQPGITDPRADGDLEGHLRFLARIRAIAGRGTRHS